MKLFSDKVRLPFLLACLLTLSVVDTTTAAAKPPAKGDANWPQWRGPGGQGVSAEKDVPVEWSATKNVRWKAPVEGRGHSSPIVWGKRVFLTTSIEGEVVPGAKAVKHMNEGQEFLHPDSVGADRKQTFKVLCFDRDTGKLLWARTAYEGTVYDNRHKKNTYASSTPATDGKRVYAFFGSEGLYAYDFKGKQIWKADLGKLGTVGMGPGASPVLHENLVIMQCDHEEGKDSFIVALDKRTGKEVWRVPRKIQVSWATPLLVRTAKRTELITNGNEAIISYDPLTGQELWRGKGVESNAIATPVAFGDTVILAAGSPAKIAMAIRLGASGDVTGTPSIIWKYTKGTAYVPSPILYGEYLYLPTDRGSLTCLDAKTGAVKYEGARLPVTTMFTASPVAFDGKILMASQDGDTFVIQTGAVHSVVRTNSLGEPVYASPAIAGGRIFIRGEKHLYSIGKDAN